MGIFALMGKLTEDILAFLEGHGLECTVRRVEGFDFIRIVPQEGIPPVLPLDIDATDEQAAADAARRLGGVLEAAENREGYPLVVTEDRWRSQSDMMQSRLLAHLRIFTQVYARNCEVRKLDRQTAAEFLMANHSYGDAKCRYRYGLYLKRHTGHNAGTSEVSPGTLVAVATFSNARRWIKGDKTIRSYEWTRYSSLPGVRLSGGMGKLLKTFIDEVNPDDIMTYADLEWSVGKVYEQLGFRLEGTKQPVVFRIDASWRRFPVKPGMTEGMALKGTEGNLFFQNPGSNKYRLKLTDYQ